MDHRKGLQSAAYISIAIQTIALLTWSYLIYFFFGRSIPANDMLFFTGMTIYWLCFWAFTFNLIRKKVGQSTTRSIIIKLSLILFFAIVPNISFCSFLILHYHF